MRRPRPARPSRRALRLVALVAGGLGPLNLGPGCATIPRRPDLTGDRTVEMYVRGAERMFARYRVDRDGTLSFGGGLEAQQGEYSWSGPLTADEIDRLFTLIDANGWYETDPPSTFTPPDRIYDIRLFRGGKRRRFEVKGDGPSVTPVYELLDRAARRRNDEFLDSLPAGGERR